MTLGIVEYMESMSPVRQAIRLDPEEAKALFSERPLRDPETLLRRYEEKHQAALKGCPGQEYPMLL